MNELFQYIECAGGPYERGRQYGEAAREAIRANLTARQPRPPDPAQVRTACAMLERHAAEVYAELQGLAEGSGAPLEKLVQEACTGSPPPAQCTSMAIAAGAEGPVLGKNNDGADDGRRWVVRRTNPDHGHPMLQVLSAGWLSGLDTMNAAGLVNGHSSVGSALARERDSLEIRLWTHALMQRCGTVADFLDGLRALPLNGKGFNLVVADAQGDTAVLECAVPRVVVRDRGADFVYATNHYVTPELRTADGRTPRKKEISTCRHGFLEWTAATAPPSTTADVRQLLGSHAPWAPCRHGGLHESWTLWSMLAEPAARRIHVADGPPCTTAYTTHQL